MSALKEQGAASVDELRDFLQGMRGKSAQEVLGVIAQSGLVRGVVQATLATLVLVAAFTVGPYYLYGRVSAKPATAPGANASPSAEDPTAKAPKAGAAPVAGVTADAASPATAGVGQATDAATSPAGAPADLERAAKVLGVGETKGSDPKSNPREKDLDSLLDKIK